MAKKNNLEKTVLVAGGAGFVGSHLCDRLIETCKVICVDNFVSGSHSNIEHLLTNPNFEFINYDLAMPLDLESIPELDRFDIRAKGLQEVYNLACPTSPKDFDKYKIETLDANSIVVKNLLELALKYNAKFLHLSSSVVYGGRDDEKKSFKENDQGIVDHLSPRACYDEGKRFAETIVETYRTVHSMDTKIARVFRTYGPRLKLFQGEMLSDFIVNALDDKDLVIYGDKNFTTSLTYIDDVVLGITLLMDSSETGPVNLGGIQDYNLTEVAEKIIAMTGSKSNIKYEAPLLFTTQLGLPDITLAKESLGWVPVTRLEDGLLSTIDYAKANKVILKSEYM